MGCRFLCYKYTYRIMQHTKNHNLMHYYLYICIKLYTFAMKQEQEYDYENKEQQNGGTQDAYLQ